MSTADINDTAYALDGDRPVQVTITGVDRCCAACYRVTGYDVEDGTGRRWFTRIVWATAAEAALAASELAEALDL